MGELLNSTGLFLQVSVELGTHVLLATLGGILCEKVGNLNLGIEGMMLLGAVGGFAAALSTGNALVALLTAGVCGMLGALIYAVLTVTLCANQTVTGLALSIFGIGVSSTIGVSFGGALTPAGVRQALSAKAIPVLSDIPLIGPMLFNQSPMVLISLALAVLLYFFYNKTSVGLNTRMVGENPAAADAGGINVARYKYANILAGGFLCGLGGGFFLIVYAGRWQNQITAGAGWIAVALVIFSLWNPLRAILGAYLFGAVRGVAFKLQSGIHLFGLTLNISAQLLDMLPYLVTIAVLVFITLNKRRENQPPAALGVPYFREER